MLYEIYARSLNTVQLLSNNSRQVNVIFNLEERFRLLNSPNSDRQSAIFNRESKLIIKKAGIWINGAAGLRPAISYPLFQIAESSFNILDRELKQLNFKCPEFGTYYDENIEIDYSNNLNQFYPQTASVYYDAFDIKNEFHGKDFGCICKMLVECSGLA